MNINSNEISEEEWNLLKDKIDFHFKSKLERTDYRKAPFKSALSLIGR